MPKNPADLGTRRARRSRKVPEGPARQKRSPASPASENGANRKKSSSRKSIAARPNAQESEQHFYWISAGQITIGFVEQVGERFTAKDDAETDLGVFDSLKVAADAVSANHDNGSRAEPLFEGAA